MTKKFLIIKFDCIAKTQSKMNKKSHRFLSTIAAAAPNFQKKFPIREVLAGFSNTLFQFATTVFNFLNLVNEQGSPWDFNIAGSICF